MESFDEVPHPGVAIRESVIPDGMSVKKAAELVGVGRPALSNLLNGNASLSADMAARLEKAFNFPRDKLLEMQANYDAARAKTKRAPVGAKTYVPPFLGIKANQIEQWTRNNNYARSRLAVFLRTLVHSTGRALTEVDFPGNDDAERPGWDGFVVSDEPTPWIPEGRSGWEFGVTKNVKKKADGDFSKSLAATNEDEQKATTFVFVTTNRWPAKDDWAQSARKRASWKDVRVYDASDLEQWLEQSLPGQVWFANETFLPAREVRSLDKCWRDWADVCSPALTGELFGAAIDETKRVILSRLSGEPGEPIAVAADSSGEGLAFLSQIFGEAGGEELAVFRDRVLVFDKPGVLAKIAHGAQNFIPVAYTQEVQRELAGLVHAMHSIIVVPRNSANVEPHVTLEPLPLMAFDKALASMGKTRDEITSLANKSGRSLTVLRRQVSNIPALKTPAWAADQDMAQRIMPFMFVGAWNSGNKADREALSILSGGRPYEELERTLQMLVQLEDAPVWSIGKNRGVVSKIDLLFAIADAVTQHDLEKYFTVARTVLGEDDPALDLAEDKRWAAEIYGKKREFSGAFREGISETLVLLAINRQLFSERIGIDTQEEVNRVINELLPAPLTLRSLEANSRELPVYAEAAPDLFLDIIERDLKRPEPAIFGLLRPVESGVFGRSPSRSGLLWALEGLSWSLGTLPRAALILAQLARIEINDNWVNKPAHSLEAIFRSWMPQTSANLDQRVNLLKVLIERYPDVAWNICMAQFGNHSQIGDYSHKPRWRQDGYGFGEPLDNWESINKFQCEVIEMALSWNPHSLKTLSDLVERLHDLDGIYQAKVWGLIEAWAENEASDEDKATLREKVRVSVLSRRAAVRAKVRSRAGLMTKKARRAYDALKPRDIVNRFAWLFRDTWIEESADELEDIDSMDFERRDEWIRSQRVNALREVVEERGLSGIIDLSNKGKASWQIGWLAASSLLNIEEVAEILGFALGLVLKSKDGVLSSRRLISGALHGIADVHKRTELLRSMSSKLSDQESAFMLTLAPYRQSTWDLVDHLCADAQSVYWDQVYPDWIHDSDEENSESVNRLVKVGRYRAAFACIKFHPEKVDSLVLFNLMNDMARGGNDRSGEYLIDGYTIEKAFKYIGNSPAITLEQKATLEFAYIDVLAQPWGGKRSGYGIPNLEKYIERHPELFVQAIVWAYRRSDGGVDPDEFQVPENRIQIMAERGRKLLDSIKCIPGHDATGALNEERLAGWVADVRRACSELDRGAVADICIGNLLASAPIGDDGVWPCEPVRQVIEDIQSNDIISGAHTAVYNARGAHWRGEGGGQERELAEKYRKWGEALLATHPFVACKLLLGLTKTYEQEASREDIEARIRRRMK